MLARFKLLLSMPTDFSITPQFASTIFNINKNVLCCVENN